MLPPAHLFAVVGAGEFASGLQAHESLAFRGPGAQQRAESDSLCALAVPESWTTTATESELALLPYILHFRV